MDVIQYIQKTSSIFFIFYIKIKWVFDVLILYF